MKQIPLRARDGSVRAYALVDDEDHGFVSQWRWQLQSSGHVARRDNTVAGGGRTIGLHRAIAERILGRPLVGLVHHKHERPLDNRRAELVIIERSARWVGTYLYRDGVRWRAMYQNKHLGLFGTREQAREARLEAVRGST